LLENYIKTINIEALTMLEMAKRQILPAVIGFAATLADSIVKVKSASTAVSTSAQEALLSEVSDGISSLSANIAALEKALDSADAVTGGDVGKLGDYYRDVIFTTMGKLRAASDKLETVVDAKVWPLPTYADMLFNV
jgi:glutamine synthetase